MQSWANGKYEAQYHMYAGIWTNKQASTRRRLSKRSAEIRVPNKALPNIILVIFLFSSTMDLNCLWKPIKKPVLDYYKKYPAIDIMFPKEKSTANLAGLPVARLRKEPNDSICIKYP